MTTITRTMPIERARALAEDLDLGDDFLKALVEADALSYSVVDVELNYGVDGTSNLAIGRHDGVMVSLTVPAEIGSAYAIPRGMDIYDFHITVLYLGDLADFTVEQQQQIIGIVTETARDWKTLEGSLTGIGCFEKGDGDWAVWIGVQITSLHELRSALVRKFETAGFEIPNLDRAYEPHMTVAILPKSTDEEELDNLKALAIQSSTVRFAKLTAAIGGAHYDAPFFADGFYGETPLSGPNSTGTGYLDGPGSAYRPGLFKSLEIRKDEMFTLGAWYVPDFVDAHGDWIATADIEKTLHDYVRSGDRFIRLQHNPDILAGEWVEAYIQRTALSVDVPDPDTGEMVKHHYPAGTPFLAVHWTPWAWELVKAGEIRGYSIGGTAESIAVDLGPEAAASAA